MKDLSKKLFALIIVFLICFASIQVSFADSPEKTTVTRKLEVITGDDNVKRYKVTETFENAEITSWDGYKIAAFAMECYNLVSVKINGESQKWMDTCPEYGGHIIDVDGLSGKITAEYELEFDYASLEDTMWYYYILENAKLILMESYIEKFDENEDLYWLEPNYTDDALIVNFNLVHYHDWGGLFDSQTDLYPEGLFDSVVVRNLFEPLPEKQKLIYGTIGPNKEGKKVYPGDKIKFNLNDNKPDVIDIYGHWGDLSVAVIDKDVFKKNILDSILPVVLGKDDLRVSFLYNGKTKSVDFTEEDKRGTVSQAFFNLIERLGQQKVVNLINQSIVEKNQNYANRIAQLTDGVENKNSEAGKYLTPSAVSKSGRIGRITGDKYEISKHFNFINDEFNGFNQVNYDDLRKIAEVLSNEKMVGFITANLQSVTNEDGLGAPYYNGKPLGISVDFNESSYTTGNTYEEFMQGVLTETHNFLKGSTRDKFGRYNQLNVVLTNAGRKKNIKVSFAPTIKEFLITDEMANTNLAVANLRDKLVRYANADLDGLRAGLEPIELVRIYENIDKFSEEDLAWFAILFRVYNDVDAN